MRDAPPLRAAPLTCPDGIPYALYRLDLEPTPRALPLLERVWRRHGFIDDVSPDGRFAVFNYPWTPKLTISSVDGSTSRTVYGGGLGPPGSASWAPDGKSLAVTLPHGLWRLDVESKRLTEVVPGGSTAAWSPGSDALAVSVTPPGGAGARLVIAAASGDHQLDVAESEPYEQATWSPSGRWVAYSSLDNPRPGHLNVIRRDGSGHRVLGRWVNPSWGRRDTTLAVDSRSGGRSTAINLLDLRGRVLRRVAAPPARLPAWSPDGRWIVFVAPAAPDDRDQLFAVRPDGSGRRQLTHDPEIKGVVTSDSIERVVWVTRGPLVGRRLFYFRDFCDDESD